ncbi:CoA transferase [Mesorhizobium sp. M0983]|uniref:CoA transferase n=1 Tax=Mesorhizobium sp. M0983 TaxID=2957040 RepID=UPI0033355741
MARVWTVSSCRLLSQKIGVVLSNSTASAPLTSAPSVCSSPSNSSKSRWLAWARGYRAQLAAAIAKQTVEAWAGLFDAMEIPWGHVHDLKEVAGDPQLRTRDLFVRLSPEDGGEWHVNQPLQFNCYKTGIRLPPPQLGEHTREILSRCPALLRSEKNTK